MEHQSIGMVSDNLKITNMMAFLELHNVLSYVVTSIFYYTAMKVS
jgi:hypothetical protein